MSTERNRDRPISAQRLPISIPSPRTRPFPGAARPAAAFLAQLLTGRPALPAGYEAQGAYRRAEMSDTRRLPPGYRKNLSA